MSFVLKPVSDGDKNKSPSLSLLGSMLTGNLAAMVPKVEEIVWTFGRSPAPELLAGRVPDDVWASTFDAFYAHTADQHESGRKMMDAAGGLPCIPCCVPCIIAKNLGRMGEVAKEAERLEKAWLKLVQDEQQKYMQYGVQISPAQEWVTRTYTHSGGARSEHGSNTYTKTELETVGLKFDTAAVMSPPVQGEMVREADA